MRIALSCIGSTGDVQPFQALALRLKRHGHDPVLCTHALFKEKTEALGIGFHASAPNVTMELLNEQVRDILHVNPVSAVFYIVEHLLMRDAFARYQDCLRGFQGADLIVCHHNDFPGQEAAIRLGIPWVAVVLSPEVVKTRMNMPLPFTRVSLGPWINAILWGLGHWGFRQVTRKPMAQLHGAIGGSPRRPDLDMFPLSPFLNLAATSRHVAWIERDFPHDKVLLTGSWHLEEDDSFAPPEDLKHFLAKGQRPLVISFGSMGAGDGDRVTRILAEAVKLSGRRAIVQKGWGGLAVGKDERFFEIGYVPHGYLFRQASCVIHHGGAGTTAAACRAGRPQIVVPHILDQFYWNRCMKAHGVAPGMVPRVFLTPQRLAGRIRQVHQDHRFADNALRMGERLSLEDGVGAAVAAIERLMKQVRAA